MPPKAKIAAPIDRPLARAYQREFSGWSTAYPPGVSEPTSQRILENMMVNRDGTLRLRPGLRYLSYSSPPAEGGIEYEVVPFGSTGWAYKVVEMTDEVDYSTSDVSAWPTIQLPIGNGESNSEAPAPPVGRRV